MAPWSRFDQSDEETSCCKTRKSCIVITVLSILLGVSLILMLLLGLGIVNPPSRVEEKSGAKPSTPQTVPPEGSVCGTRKCFNISLTFMNELDHSLDPCDDFYGYVCNKWIEDHPTSKKFPYITPYTEIEDSIPKLLRNVLEHAPQNELSYLTNVRRFYQSCMDVVSIENGSALASLKAELIGYGGWPSITPDWTSADFSLEKTSAEFNWIMATSGFLVAVSPDHDLSSNTATIYVMETNNLAFGSRADYYTSSNMFGRPWYWRLYEQYVRNVTMAFGADEETATTDARALSQFDLQLAKITGTKESEHNLPKDELLKAMTLQRLSIYSPNIDWSQLLNIIFAKVGGSTDGSLRLRVKNLSYFTHLSSLIQRTSKRTLANYMMWRRVDYMIHALPEKYRIHKTNYDQQVLRNPPERWQYCVSQTKKHFSKLLGRMYVEQYFSSKTRRSVQNIVKNVKTALGNIIKEENWMDATTTKKAINKLNKLNSSFGYTDIIYDDKSLRDFYKDLRTSSTDFSDNINKVNKVSSSYIYKWYVGLQLTSPSFRWDDSLFESWLDPITVNAEYSSVTNSIEIAAVFLTQYDSFYLDATKYGDTATAVGHELTHGFDSKGRLYDGDGNLDDWWTTSSQAAYDTRADCLVRQYGEKMIPLVNETIKGQFTLQENIADNGGLKAAFMAYQIHKKNSPPNKLPGLMNFTPEQFFFISYAKRKCTSITENYASILWRTDSHSPNKFRVELPLSNYKEFAMAFNCTAGSNYNPTKRCVVW